ncbi:ribonuclease P protein component [Candidatus Dependentiae bacterium]|nr:ribonuclease P protein component [Candidatus Dependentiae bacterium]
MLNFSIARKITSFTNKEIYNLRKSAKKIFSNESFDIKRKNKLESVEIGRILIVIPKKVGSAPVRNKIRRQIKSIFYQEKKYQLPSDFIVYVKPHANELKFEEIHEILNKVLC